MTTPEPPTGSPPQSASASQRPPAGSGDGVLRLVALVFYLVSMVSLLLFAWSALTSSLRYDRYGSYSDDQTYYTDYPSPTPTHVPSISRIGETIIIGNMAATLLSIEIIPADQIHRPSPGDVIILAHLKLANLDADWQYISATNFAVTTSSGHPWDYHLPLGDPPSWYAGGHYLSFQRLDSSATFVGDLIVTAPLGDHQAKLVWDLDFKNVADSGWILSL